LKLRRIGRAVRIASWQVPFEKKPFGSRAVSNDNVDFDRHRLRMRRSFPATKLKCIVEIPCFASSPHDEFACSWFHRRLFCNSQQFAAARRLFATAPVISILSRRIVLQYNHAAKHGYVRKFLQENIKDAEPPVGVQERADSTTAVSGFRVIRHSLTY
jgi:hypothetical protein